MTLTPNTLISAYAQGIFPMAHNDGNIYWYDPDPRAIIPLERFHIPRRLRRKINQQPFEIRIDSNFTAVMVACAGLTEERESTWIDGNIISAYTQLHELGFAHSVEAWQDDQLVGGLYGVAVRGVFAGESMFSYATDASKICLAALVERLCARNYRLLDTQFITTHLERFGAIEIPRAEYKRQLAMALQVDAHFI